MDSNKKENKISCPDITYSLGNHLKRLELNYSRENVLINTEIKSYLYIYNVHSNVWNYEELNSIY